MLPLERVDRHDGTVDPAATQSNFDTLRSLVPGFGGKGVEVRYGTSSVTFTASAASAQTVVAHGLGIAPVCAYVTYRHATGSTVLFSPYIDTVGAVNIGISCTASSALTGALAVDWLVIG